MPPPESNIFGTMGSRKDVSPRAFWWGLAAISLLITLARYREPMLIYPYADDWWHYVHTQSGTISSTMLGTLGARPLWYLLLYLLQPAAQSSGLLAEAFPMFGNPHIPQIQYMIWEMALVILPLIPLAGWVAWRMTGSRVAGLLVGLLMALSPYQNLIAPTLEPQAFQLYAVAVLGLRLWTIDLNLSQRRDLIRAGILTGLLACAGVSSNYHVWYFLIVALPLTGLQFAVRLGTGPLGKFRFKDGIVRVVPYAAAVTMGLFTPLLAIDLLFRVNILSDGLFFPVAKATQSYFDSIFALRQQMTLTPGWSVRGGYNNLHGFVLAVRHQIGGWGALLLAAAIVWALIRPMFIKARGLPWAMPATILAGFIFISQPTMVVLGRMTMPFEVTAYVLIAQLIIDSMALGRNWRRPALVTVPILGLMLAHMSFTTIVVLNDLLGIGRAAQWLKSTPSPLYFAQGPWAASPSLSVADARIGARQGFLVAVAETSSDWQQVLKHARPIRVWRTQAAAWRSFHSLKVGEQYDYFWDHIVVYDLAEIRKILAHEKEKP